MSTGSDPINYKEACEETCRIAENTRLALMKALARVERLTRALECYADPKFYRPDGAVEVLLASGCTFVWKVDRGEIARKALEEDK